MNVEKSNVFVFSKRRHSSQTGILFGGEYIEQTRSVSHLGILQESDLKLHNRIEDSLQKAKKSFFAMASQGLHPRSVNPLVSVEL